MKRPSERLTSEQVIEAASRMVPALRERADETDRERRVSSQTFEELQAAGLLHILKPDRYGGFEMGLYEFAKIGMELSRGCMSTGWIFSLLCEHCWFVSLFPPEAQEEMWGQDSYSVTAASLAASASRSHVVHEKGGYRISGQFPFTSGSDHAQWLILGAIVESDDASGSPVEYLFLVPKYQLELLDDWFVLGLRGTGSRAYVASEVFVPFHRAVSRDDLFNARTPGPAFHPTFDLVHSPRSRISPFVTSAPSVGAALGAIEVFPDVLGGASRQGAMVGSDAFRLKFSESAAEAYAARLIIESDTKETMTYVRAREPLPEELQARVARDAAYTGLLSQRSVDRLQSMLGTASIFDGNPVQRGFRDIHTALAQASMHWDTRALSYADVLLRKTHPAPQTPGLGHYGATLSPRPAQPE